MSYESSWWVDHSPAERLRDTILQAHRTHKQTDTARGNSSPSTQTAISPTSGLSASNGPSLKSAATSALGNQRPLPPDEPCRYQNGCPRPSTGTSPTTPPGRDGLIFTAPEGGPIRRNTFRSRFWLPAVADSVGQPMRFHDLRHSHVTLLIATTTTIVATTTTSVPPTSHTRPTTAPETRMDRVAMFGRQGRGTHIRQCARSTGGA
jgi:hypothetical protein